MHCLVKIQEHYKDSSDSKDVEKRNDAVRLLGLIKNKRFCMHLSGLADIYNMFGMFVNVVQKVNVLPHERYDSAIQVLDTMAKMKSLTPHEKCETESCLWPSYHKDVRDDRKMIENEASQNIKIDKNSSSAHYQTRFAKNAAAAGLQTDPIKQTQDNILLLVTRLEKDLRAEVFDETTVKLIEKIRLLTDLKSLAKEILKRGHVIVAAQNCKLFVENVKAVTNSLDDVPDEELRDAYRRFLHKLEDYVKNKDMKKITSMSILQDFLKTKLKLFEGVELVLHGIVCGAVKVSVESVVETLVSRYESHFNKNRNLDETNAMDEMLIVENGPTIFQANSVLKTAMNHYWKENSKNGNWHFIRDSSSSILDFGSTYGKTTMKLMQQSSKFPVMDV